VPRDIGVGSYNASFSVDELAIEVRTMIFILLDNSISADWRFIARAATGDIRFPDKPLPLVEVRTLLTEIDGDRRSSRNTVPLPNPFGSQQGG
jgi:hypothetical protein